MKLPNYRKRPSKFDELAAATGLTTKVIRNRMYRGWTEEEIRAGQRHYRLDYDTEQINRVAEITGLPRSSVYNRIKKGETLEQIEQTGRLKAKKSTPVKDQQESVNWSELAKKLTPQARAFCCLVPKNRIAA